MKPNNLNTFRILFLIKGILTLCASIFPLIYAFFGMFMFSEIAKHDQNMPFNPGIILLIFGVFGFLLLIALGILDIIASKRLDEARSYQFIFVVAIVSCVTGGLLGILLGIFTLIEIRKPHVKVLFDKNKV